MIQHYTPTLHGKRKVWNKYITVQAKNGRLYRRGIDRMDSSDERPLMAFAGGTLYLWSVRDSVFKYAGK
jgi:hypothetical protein